jgi:hypothetical protein
MSTTHPAETNWLLGTPRIDCAAPEIQAAVASLAGPPRDERAMAVRIHDFVRDQIRFGWSLRFDRQTASEVLRARRGYCNTKSGLFMALLRAAEIPARLHCVAINRDILRGLVRPPTSYVDHTYVEVRLEGIWHSTDSYIVDRALFTAAQRRLRREGAELGYGVHCQSTLDWDGRKDAFAQFVPSAGKVAVRGADFGVYDDLDAFYASGKGHGPPGSMLRLLLCALLPVGNARVAALRTEAT